MITYPNLHYAPAATHMLVDACGNAYSQGTLEQMRAELLDWEDSDPRTLAAVGFTVVPRNAYFWRPDARNCARVQGWYVGRERVG